MPSFDNSPSCWRSLRLRLVRGFLDHWESYDFTLTKIHCDVSHCCIARKFLLLLGAKTFSGKYAHCEPGSSSIERDSGCVADGSIVSESKAVLKDGACIPFLWSFEPFDLFRQKQWHLRMGLKPLDLADWIHVDDHFQEQLLLKETLLAQDPSACFAALPDSMKGQREVFDTVLTHLLKYFPHMYRLDTASKSIHHAQSIHNLVTGQSWTIQDLTPLDLAGRLVQEDLLLLQPLNHEFQLRAGSLCFPSYWRLQDKLGLPLSQIHDPVPDYAKHLTSKVTHYFDHMRSTRPGWRWNWSLTDTPDLRLAEERSRGSVITRHNAGLSLWLRIERQTLRRLSEQVLFSIHTYIHPLEDIVSDPEQAVGLSRILRTMPESTQRYKGLWDIREELLAYLDLKQ